jgi:hypothetical protein
MSLNIVQRENQLRGISYGDLVQQLRQMTQMGEVGTLKYLMTAGEIQARDDATKKQMALAAAADPKNARPVIADLLTGGAMPPQMPTQTAMLPEDAGGIAALPAPNMDNMEPYTAATGGLVAFDAGGSVKRKFEALPRYVGEEAGIPGAELADFFKSQMRGDVRVDPVTGRPVTFGEFMRLEDERTAAAARTPAIQAIPPGVAASSQPQISVNQPTSFLGGMFNMAAPGISGTSQPGANVPVVPPAVTGAPTGAGLPTGTAAARDDLRLSENAGLAALRRQALAGQNRQQDEPDVLPKAKPIALDTVAPSPFNIDSALTQGVAAAKGLLKEPPAVPAQTTLDDIKKAYKDEQQLFKDLGIEDPTKLRREQLEKEMQEAKTEKKQAGYRWLANFGFSWAAQNGPTLQAAAKAGEKTLPGLYDDIKDLDKLERDRRKELAGLAALNAQAQRDITAKARDRLTSERTRAEERVDRYNQQIATVGASIGGQLVQRDTSLQLGQLQAATTLQAAQIGADSRRAETKAEERRIAQMPGESYAERLTNYFKAVRPSATADTNELDKLAAQVAKDPVKLAQLKVTDPGLYALVMQRINTLAVPTATSTATGRVRD